METYYIIKGLDKRLHLEGLTGVGKCESFNHKYRNKELDLYVFMAEKHDNEIEVRAHNVGWCVKCLKRYECCIELKTKNFEEALEKFKLYCTAEEI